VTSEQVAEKGFGACHPERSEESKVFRFHATSRCFAPLSMTTSTFSVNCENKKGGELIPALGFTAYFILLTAYLLDGGVNPPPS